MARRFLNQREARRYVRGVLVSMLRNEFIEPAGWMFGGLEDKRDRQLVSLLLGRMIARLEAKR